MDPLEEIIKLKEAWKMLLDALGEYHQIDVDKMEAVKAAFSLEPSQESNANGAIAKEKIILDVIDPIEQKLGL